MISLGAVAALLVLISLGVHIAVALGLVGIGLILFAGVNIPLSPPKRHGTASTSIRSSPFRSSSSPVT